MRLRPTRRLPGMLAAAAVIFLFATNSQVIWLYLVASLVLGLVLVGLVAPLMVLRRLRPRLTGHTRAGFLPPLPQDRGRVFAGDRVTLLLELGDHLPPVAFGPLRAGIGTLAVDGRIEAGRGLVELTAGRRGRLELAALRLSTSWPLGIARAQRWVRLDHTLVVHPRYLLPGDERRQGTREPAGASTRRGAGDDFLGLREYRSGDSQRRIHWPTSARTGNLMVIETAEETSNAGTYELLLSAGATQAAAELAVSVAASLAAGNIAAGIPVAMSVPGQPRYLNRWPEVLSGLATAATGEASPQRRGRQAVRVTASGNQVTWAREESVEVVDANTSLEEAVARLGGLG